MSAAVSCYDYDVDAGWDEDVTVIMSRQELAQLLRREGRVLNVVCSVEQRPKGSRPALKLELVEA